MTNDHLSLDELAELDEGLLPPERTSSVRAHLHVCEQCRARSEAIRTTRSMLADLPAVSMPLDVQARLEQVMADAQADAHAADRPTLAAVPPPRADTPTEPSERDEQDESAQTSPDPTVRSATVTPDLAAVSRPRFGRPTLAASAAAASVVLAVGAIIVAHYQHSGSGHQATIAGSAATGGSSSTIISPTQPRNFVQSSTGRDYTTANLATEVQSLIVTTPATSAGAAGAGAAAGASPSATPGSASGGAGTGANNPGRKNAKSDSKRGTPTVRTPAPTPAAPNLLPTQPVPAALQPLARSRAKILACAAVVAAQRNAVPLAVDFGRWTDPPTFDHSPVAIFIFKSHNPSNVSVFVVGPACDGNAVRTFSVVPLPS